ncbi:MAG: glycosyltransferase [Desulfuromonadales bacterium]|nr:glycosyltransferase [Desulfuromonadales bacterium]
MKPIISVIIATFNAAKTLRNCLESIVTQKNECIELLVIDGGSTDGTPNILEEYSSQIDVIVSEHDHGIYDAWNKGIINSHGEWIMFIGADDTLEHSAFEKYFEFLNRHKIADIDFISAKYLYIGRAGQVLKVFGVPWSWEQFRRKMTVAHVGSLHRRALFHDVGLYDLQFRICGDYELLLRKKERLRTLFMDEIIARMAMGGASYSMNGLRETHHIQHLYSGVSPVNLKAIHLWQILLFWRHYLLHSNIWI